MPLWCCSLPSLSATSPSSTPRLLLETVLCKRCLPLLQPSPSPQSAPLRAAQQLAVELRSSVLPPPWQKLAWPPFPCGCGRQWLSAMVWCSIPRTWGSAEVEEAMAADNKLPIPNNSKRLANNKQLRQPARANAFSLQNSKVHLSSLYSFSTIRCHSICVLPAIRVLFLLSATCLCQLP